VFLINGAGAITATPTSGQNFTATVAGAGTVDITSATGNITLDATAAELNLDDVGSWGGTLSQSGDRTLVQTAAGELLNGATSLIGAINRLANFAEVSGGPFAAEESIENTVVIAAGDCVAQSSVSGRVALWNGNNNTNSKFLGIALTGGTGDVGGTVLCRFALPGSKVTDSGAAFTAGQALFGPDGTGRPTSTAPSGVGDAVKRVAWALTATEYILEPGPTVEL
jgi:hypothetical protein